jgi:hypothetical protein
MRKLVVVAITPFDDELDNLIGTATERARKRERQRLTGEVPESMPDLRAAESAVRAIHEADEALIEELAGILTAVWYALPKSFRDDPKIDALLLKVANRNKPQGGEIA